MAIPLQKNTYPHIGSDPEIADGEPIVIGTRITVRCIAGYYQMGMSADENLSIFLFNWGLFNQGVW